jgi:uncharacterized protein (DUF2147 family)
MRVPPTLAIPCRALAAVLFVLAAIRAGTAVAQPAASEPPSMLGVWSNPKRNVQVRTERCRDRLCGTIVQAAPSALAAARAKGVASLEGTRVFEDMQRRDDGIWRGKLYVPDRGGRFASTLRLLDENRLEVRGCILGGLICKSQVWTRVG